jgi:hypothetical protein
VAGAAYVAHGDADAEGVTACAPAAPVATVPAAVAAGVGVTVAVALGEPETAKEVAVAYDTSACTPPGV